jgi:hypothetical protein
MLISTLHEIQTKLTWFCPPRLMILKSECDIKLDLIEVLQIFFEILLKAVSA